MQKRTTKKAEKAEATRYAVNDYYNPEGQHRNYQRNVASYRINILILATGEDLDTSTCNKSIMAVPSHHRRLEMPMNERSLDDWLMKQLKEKRKRKKVKTERV